MSIEWDDSLATGNDLRYAVIEYAGKGNGAGNFAVADAHDGAIWLDEGASVAMANSIVRNSVKFGVEVADKSTLRDFTNNTFTGNGDAHVALYADQVRMLGAGSYEATNQKILIRGGTVENANSTWLNLGVPYVIEEDITIGGTNPGKVTVNYGTKIQLMEGKNIIVTATTGTLLLKGTAAGKITITSFGGNDVYWGRIILNSANANWFDYTDISKGGQSSYGQVYMEAGSVLTYNYLVMSNRSTSSSLDLYRSGNVTATAVLNSINDFD